MGVEVAVTLKERANTLVVGAEGVARMAPTLGVTQCCTVEACDALLMRERRGVGVVVDGFLHEPHAAREARSEHEHRCAHC